MAAVTALLLYLPNLWWNIGTGFVTYAHTVANASLGGRLIRPDKLADFVLSQFGVFGPIVFAVLLWLLFRPDRWLREPRARLDVMPLLFPAQAVPVGCLRDSAPIGWSRPSSSPSPPMRCGRVRVFHTRGFLGYKRVQP